MSRNTALATFAVAAAVSALSVLTLTPCVLAPVTANILPPTFQASCPPPQGSETCAPGRAAQIAVTVWRLIPALCRASRPSARLGGMARPCYGMAHEPHLHHYPLHSLLNQQRAGFFRFHP